MNMLKRLLIGLVFAAVAIVPLPAQTYLTTTTLASAITSLTTTTVFLTSTAGITASYCGGSVSGCGLFVDREVMSVSSVPVSGQVNVTRGAYSGTTAATHLSGRVVFIAPLSAFSGSDYDGTNGRTPGGPCSAAANKYLPVINVTNGNVWLCRPGVASVNGSTTSSATWVATNTSPITYNSLMTNLQ